MKYILSIRTSQGPLYWNGKTWVWEILKAEVKWCEDIEEMNTLPFDILRCEVNGTRID